MKIESMWLLTANVSAHYTEVTLQASLEMYLQK